MRGKGNPHSASERVSRLLQASAGGAPQETKESCLRVAESLVQDERPELEDVARALLWFVEVHRQDRLAIRELKAAASRHSSRFPRLRRGKTFEEQYEQQACDPESESSDPWSEAISETGIPGSEIQYDRYGRRILIVPGDKNGT